MVTAAGLCARLRCSSRTCHVPPEVHLPSASASWRLQAAGERGGGRLSVPARALPIAARTLPRNRKSFFSEPLCSAFEKNHS